MNPPTSPPTPTGGTSTSSSSSPNPPHAPPSNKRARKPCSNCINSKVACDQQRPCARCTKQGRQSTCKDVPRKQRNKKPRDDILSDDSLDSPTSSTTIFHSIRNTTSPPQPHHSHYHTPLHSAPFSALHVPRAASPPAMLSPSPGSAFVWSHSQSTLHYSPNPGSRPHSTTQHDSHVPPFFDKSILTNAERMGASPRTSYPALPNYNYKMHANYYPSQHKFPISPAYSSELHDFLLPNPDSMPAPHSISPYALPDPQHYHSEPHPSTSASSSNSNCNFIPSHLSLGSSSPHDDPDSPSPPSTSHESYLPAPNLTWHMSNTDPHAHSHHNLNLHNNPLVLSSPNIPTHNNSHNNSHSTHHMHPSLHSSHNNTHTSHNSSIHNIHPNHTHSATHLPHSAISNITNISSSNHINLSNSFPHTSHTNLDHAPALTNNLHTLGNSSLQSSMIPPLHHNFPLAALQESHGHPGGHLQPSQMTYASDEPTFMVMMSTRVLVDCNMGFARLLGYDTPTSLVLGNGLVLLEELSPPQFQKYIMNVWKNAIDQGMKTFDRITSFKTRSGNIVFCAFTASVLDDNMHGIGVITQVLDYADLPPVLKSKLGDVFF